MNSVTTDRRHHWAAIVAILAGVVALGFAMWGIPLRADDVGDNVGWGWGVYAVAGALALIAVAVAQRSATPAKVLLGVAGLALLLVPLAMDSGAATWIVNVVLGAAMLVAAPFIGYVAPDLPPGTRPR